MTILDTHAWLWWVGEPGRLGARARRLLGDARRIGVPAICCLEVAALTARERIVLDRPPLAWMQEALALPRVELMALTPAIAVKAVSLPQGFAGDAADRLIVATALIEGGTLITRDDRIRQAGVVDTAWG